MQNGPALLLGRAIVGKVKDKLLLDSRNPLSNVGTEGRHFNVVALEVEWTDVQGIDFLLPLHQVCASAV